ncbi:hypothetical protein CC80DRAFT_596767 [Byssothecium circinans]|uniref:Zn(2)-C6 fungal-type domain-containing protein n=1 Tax=Byssothecium circinans TaxID=147558 RepID=A0A6A5TKB7_9PLEO|nr:hypothetical protein CC80DRAFT_596767 [Byssothecium circinans]
MVGVPGRSKACITCRRRRKGCDLKTPSCGQCERMGIMCGGYDPDRMWINHAVVPTQTATRPRPASQTQHSSTIAQDNAVTVRAASTQTHNFLCLAATSRPSLTASAYAANTIETFFSMWNPDTDNNAVDKAELLRFDGFENVMSKLYVQDEALKLLLLALGTGLLGKNTDDVALVRQGRVLYGRGLKEMSTALASRRRVRSEALLAVPRVAGLFEILFGADPDTTVQAQSYVSHAHGLITMYTNRGPESYTDGVAHNLFSDGRKTVIISDIRARKPSILNETAWKIIPWTKHAKTPKDLLFDIFAGIPEILSRIDTLDTLDPTSHASAQLRASTLRACKTLETQMRFWTSINENLVAPMVRDEPTPIFFPDRAQAYLTVNYWCLALYIYQSIQTLIIPDSSSTVSQYPSPIIFARLIARSTPYFFDPGKGIWGALTVAFPIGMALLALRRSRDEEDTKYIKIVIDEWRSPKIPNCIKAFLDSMRGQAAANWLKKGWSKERVSEMFLGGKDV